MVNEKYKKMLSAKSVIRELSEYATARGQEIGKENVFDFTLGNPSVPTTQDFTDAVIDMYQTKDAVSLHGYSPTLGIPSVKKTIAASLTRRFGLPYEGIHIFPTSGAAGAIAHALRAVTKPGDTVLSFAPFFPEYQHYVGETGTALLLVPPDSSTFQPDMDAFERMLEESVTAVLINSPNNPSGVVYSKETLTALSDIMRKKQEQYGHEIFLISDEPYREIAFDGETVPYPAAFYDNTLTCYSFSKSLSVPGERIGYVAVNPAAKDSDLLCAIFGQISRGIGHNCPTATMQLAVAEVIDETSDLSIYERNRNLWYDALTDMGLSVVKPGGTFYIFPKAPEEDAVAFCKKATKYDLIFVPSDSFGISGYFRIAYCVETERIERAIPVMRTFMKEEYPGL